MSDIQAAQCLMARLVSLEPNSTLFELFGLRGSSYAVCVCGEHDVCNVTFHLYFSVHLRVASACRC